MGCPRVLVADDDVDVRIGTAKAVRRLGCDVVEASDGKQALESLATDGSFDLVLSDLDMPGADGRAVLEGARARGVPVVIITGHASVTLAVELMRRGAANFLTKPVTFDAVRAVLDEMCLRAKVPDAANPSSAGAAKTATPRPRTSSGTGATDPELTIIGDTPAFRAALDVVRSVAETNATILLTGETGTGKEVVARAVHAASLRRSGPFVAVNCGAIPEALFESELFGHARGAFTGATHARTGRFRMAEGGTIFLDEIGDMPLPFQVKLLRVLQEHQYDVVGEDVPRRADVRVIAATHRHLPEMIAAGTFRDDLYYRLGVIEIELPPLRSRDGDIPMLVEHFVAAANARHGRAVTGVDTEAMSLLKSHPWPGNIRELGNVIERMVILRGTGILTPQDLPQTVRRESGVGPTSAPITPRAPTITADGIDLRRTLDEFEDSLIREALSRTGGNQSAAAALLGVNKTTLHEKAKRRGLIDRH